MTNKKSKWVLVYDEYNTGNKGMAEVFDNKKSALERIRVKSIKGYSIDEHLNMFKLYEVVGECKVVDAIAFREDKCLE